MAEKLSPFEEEIIEFNALLREMFVDLQRARPRDGDDEDDDRRGHFVNGRPPGGFIWVPGNEQRHEFRDRDQVLDQGGVLVILNSGDDNSGGGGGGGW